MVYELRMALLAGPQFGGETLDLASHEELEGLYAQNKGFRSCKIAGLAK
jgi:hypothetical protein